MPKLTLDGQEVEFEQGMTVMQVCEQAGTEVPRFCYHEKLEIAGNCRMCLVEVKPGPPKPAASCAMPANDGMEVSTKSEMVKNAREGVMEFLLINHPLDCPICDQGGECDLQDQAMMYGSGKSRYNEPCKRSVEDKHMGPIIKPHMTRCIHCTRCVRFADQIAGVPEMGAVGRGEHTEITTYIEQAIHSELSGNMIDLCPVGALTSKPYAYSARPWELKKTETIDVMDAVGSNIRVDSRGNAVLRVLPRLNEEVNEEWISDKTRYACDGLQRQRLDTPYIRDESGKLCAATWGEAFAAIKDKLANISGDKVAALAGDLACVESMVALKDVMEQIGSDNMDCRTDGAALDTSARANYLFNTTIEGLEEADVILLVGTNPRLEAPLVNARIRKRYLQGGLKVFHIGNEVDLTYAAENLGNDPKILEQIAKGKHPARKVIDAAHNPVIILGSGAVARTDGSDVLEVARHLATHSPIISKEWNGFNVLHGAASRVGGLDIGFVPTTDKGRDTAAIIDGIGQKDIEVLYLLGVDEVDTSYFDGAFVVYQGHHGDAGAACANVVLPGAAYTEKDATYVNMEGRPQRAYKAVTAPNLAKEDWRILRALSEELGDALPYDTIDEIRARIEEVAPHLVEIDEIEAAEWVPANKVLRGVKLDDAPFDDVIKNFYMTDPISRVSKTMAECTRTIVNKESESNKEQAA